MAGVTFGSADSRPHGSSTTPSEARALAVPLIATLTALLAEHRDQVERYERLLGVVAAAGAGALGKPGVVDAVDRDAQSARQAGVVIRDLEDTAALRVAELREGLRPV